jgi:dihydrofolate reductase
MKLIDRLLWHLSEDLKHYKKRTQGNICIVGFNTYNSLPVDALRGRTHIVVTGLTDGTTIAVPGEVNPRYTLKDKKYEDKSVIVFARDNVDEAIKTIEEIKKEGQEIFVIGGAQLYKSMIDLCDNAEITWINKLYPDANKRFPIDKLFKDFEIVNDSEWQKSKSGITYKFTYYKRG